MKLSNKSIAKSVDFNALMAEFSKEHDVLHHVQIYGDDYIFRILGRREYKKILHNDSLTELDMEDEICKLCVLWPEDFDTDECPAAAPTELCRQILENSFLDDITSTLRLLEYYKEEMTDLENQMICIISEAFPHYSLEEIEEWNNLKFCKMFTRAEWKFNNLKDGEIKDVTEIIRNALDLQDQGYTEEEISVKLSEEETHQQKKNDEVTFNSSPDQNTSRKGKQKLTPEKLRELQAKFPEIDWTADATKENVDVLNNSVNTVAPALRSGTWGWGD